VAEISGKRRWYAHPVVIAVAVAMVIFLGMQLVPARITNPPVKQEPPWDSAATRSLAIAACYNCHSNQTKSYWYEHVAPISWWIKNHVDEGRRALNFSEFDPNNHRGGSRLAHTVLEGGMPPNYYTWLGRHPAAKLSAAERRKLAAGLEKTYGAPVGNAGREGGDGDGDRD
jgi:hypothetical protein